MSGPRSDGTPDDESLETAESLAAYLHVATSWVYTKAESGELPSLKIGRYRRFRRSEINQWLEAQRAVTVNRSSGGSALDSKHSPPGEVPEALVRRDRRRRI